MCNCKKILNLVKIIDRKNIDLLAKSLKIKPSKVFKVINEPNFEDREHRRILIGVSVTLDNHKEEVEAAINDLSKALILN